MLTWVEWLWLTIYPDSNAQCKPSGSSLGSAAWREPVLAWADYFQSVLAKGSGANHHQGPKELCSDYWSTECQAARLSDMLNTKMSSWPHGAETQTCISCVSSNLKTSKNNFSHENCFFLTPSLLPLLSPVFVEKSKDLPDPDLMRPDLPHPKWS